MKKILWVVAVVAAFVAVKEGKQWWFDARAMDKAVAAANKEMDDMRAKAAAEHPDKPVALALQEEALKWTAEALAKESGDKKADTAADQFIGFYMANVRTRPDYCKALGVDISPFTNEFIAQHKDLYAKSRMIHARSPYATDKIENLFKQLQPTFKKTIQDELALAAKQNNATEKDVCEAFASNGKEMAAEMHLSKLAPALYQAMVEAK